jgi:hypothetical protein
LFSPIPVSWRTRNPSRRWQRHQIVHGICCHVPGPWEPNDLHRISVVCAGSSVGGSSTLKDVAEVGVASANRFGALSSASGSRSTFVSIALPALPCAARIASASSPWLSSTQKKSLERSMASTFRRSHRSAGIVSRRCQSGGSSRAPRAYRKAWHTSWALPL